ncbi:MAG: DUF2064 domain-containing protein [Wenzhouxiangellaceae bacterium]
MNSAVAIFVKTPGLSPVKTRLGRTYGSRAAEQWHRHAAMCVAASASATGLPVYWAVAEAEGMQHELWQRLPRLAQGGGGLGRRMATVHTELVRRHGGGVLIGADLPQIEPRHLLAAAAWLDAADPRHVLGPAHDGGFWLFGANRTLATAIWESVRYSRDDTAREFIKAVEAGAWEMLEPMTDLDQAEDLPAVLRQLEAIGTPTEPQCRLMRWLEQRIEQAA